MMEEELSKTYDPDKVEQKWYRLWEEGKYFCPKGDNDKEPYCIVMPPPNVTGSLHAGHALNLTIQDILIRFKRMKGYKALLIPGMDHAGIATQNVVEKELYKQEKKRRQDYSREEFIEKVWEWKAKYGGIIAKQQRLMGVSADWDSFLFTMDADANKAVKRAFVALYNEKLIYRADYIVNWDPVLQSAISDAEVEHKEVRGAFYHLLYSVKGHDESLEIATTRPETLFGDTAVCVHPEDPRFKHFIGKTAIVPLVEREVPIIADEYVDREKGTGCLKVTPGHDINDFELGKKHQLPLVTILNKDATLNDQALQFQGMSVKKARPLVVDEVEKTGKLKTIQKHTHNVGHGNRSGAVIEPMVSKQWFLNVQTMSRRSVDAIKKGPTRFWPKEWENTYFSWMQNPKNWCISRQLWWGHQIPVFYCKKKDCGHIWASEDTPKVCSKCNTKEFQQDPDVLDTWFSSALWPFSTLGWPSTKKMQEKNFKTFFPTNTLVTGFDIIFFWVARMMMMSLKFLERPPFDDIYIHAIVRDKFGRKMSKSLGNGIDPLDMIERYGTDAFRFALAFGSGYNRTLNLDPERIDGHRRFINKIWNAFRFISPFLKGGQGKNLVMEKMDHHERWILSEINETAKKMNLAFEQYRFDDACHSIYHLIYEKFCSMFIELSRPILYNKENTEEKLQRQVVLQYSFKTIIRLLHPICPFITEELWDYLKASDDERIIIQEYPTYADDLQFPIDQEQMNSLIEVVTALRNLRSSFGISPKEQVPVHLFTNNKELEQYFLSQKQSLMELMGASEVYIKSVVANDKERPSQSLMYATSHTEVFLPVSGIINMDEQIKRLEKSLAKSQKIWNKLQVKLNNDQFIQNAHPDAVEKTKKEAQELENKIAIINKQIGFIR